MPNKIRHHLPSDKSSDNRLAPRHLAKQEFARRLYAAMIKKGWHQSELARRAGLNRDNISNYVRATAMPTPQKLKQLCEALEVSEEQLMPNYLESAIDVDDPAFEMRVSPSRPSAAWLRVNRLVSLTTATKIAELLNADNLDDGSGSSAAS